MNLTIGAGAIIVAAAVLLLQIISLAKIAGLKKIITGLSKIPTLANVPNERYEKKSGDFRRQEKRNFPEQRVRQEKPPVEAGLALPAADPVEKSLRDINMKLKHAERDQEAARKRITDPLSRGDHHRGGGRNDRDRRGHRDREGQRSNRRDNWQDRNRTSEPQPLQEGSEADEARFAQESITATVPSRGITTPTRQLMEDAPQLGEGIGQEKPTEVDSTSVASTPRAPQAGGQGESAPEAEIHFGRKR